MENLQSKSLEELSNLIAEKERYLRTQQDNLATVEIRNLKLVRAVKMLQLKKTDNDGMILKAKWVVGNIKSEIREITQVFWNKKNGG